MASNSVVVDHLALHLAPDGVVFGATLLGAGVRRNAMARTIMAVYDRSGIFGNRTDSEAGLRAELGRRFRHVDVRVIGCAALFAASRVLPDLL